MHKQESQEHSLSPTAHLARTTDSLVLQRTRDVEETRQERVNSAYLGAAGTAGGGGPEALAALAVTATAGPEPRSGLTTANSAADTRVAVPAPAPVPTLGTRSPTRHRRPGRRQSGALLSTTAMGVSSWAFTVRRHASRINVLTQAHSYQYSDTKHSPHQEVRKSNYRVFTPHEENRRP